MLIGFNLATVATQTYFPADQWVGLLTTAFLIGVAVLAPGFINRIAVFLALIFGYVISWIADQFSTVQSCTAAGKCTAVHRVDWSGVAAGTLIVLIGYHAVRPFAPAHLREEPQAAGRAYEGGTGFALGNVETPEGEVSPYQTDDEDGTER